MSGNIGSPKMIVRILFGCSLIAAFCCYLIEFIDDQESYSFLGIIHIYTGHHNDAGKVLASFYWTQLNITYKNPTRLHYPLYLHSHMANNWRCCSGFGIHHCCRHLCRWNDYFSHCWWSLRRLDWRNHLRISRYSIWSNFRCIFYGVSWQMSHNINWFKNKFVPFSD